MIIGIDGNEANTSERVGVNQYAFQLLLNLYKLQDEFPDCSYEVFLKDEPRNDLPPKSNNWKYTVFPGSGMWILRKLTPHLLFNKSKIDIFFTPSHYLPPLSSIPMVCSIMDLGYLKFSEQFRKYDFWQLKLWSAMSIYISKRVLTISESTKKDIVRHYQFSSGKVRVTLPGYDPHVFNTRRSPIDVRRVKNKYTMGKDYILFLGMLKPSKNIENIIFAWNSIQKQFPDIKLVIAGKKGWLYEAIFDKVNELGIANRVIFTGFIPEEDKGLIIKASTAFLLPSFWEGFGLDVVSAMASGVPVVVSNRGSLPEVVGDAGIIVNPDRPDSIANGIKKVLTLSEEEYNMTVKRGISVARSFSWERTARETLKILREIN